MQAPCLLAHLKYRFMYLLNCVSQLHAYVDFTLGVCDHVGALLAGALKPPLLRIYQIA